MILRLLGCLLRWREMWRERGGNRGGGPTLDEAMRP